MDLINISDSETEVMKLLWNKSPLSSNEIIELLKDKEWSENTIKTFINRLLNKKAIGYEKNGRNYLYYPILTYDVFTEEKNKSFLETVYDGAVDLFLVKFLETENLTNSDIEELQNILEKKKSNKE